MVLSCSPCTKAPGISTVITSRHSFASITEVSNTASFYTVGDVASSLLVQTHCFRPSVQPLPLIRPHRFCFRNIKYPNALLFSSLNRSFTCTGSQTLHSCNCFISENTASVPFGPKTCKPVLGYIA